MTEKPLKKYRLLGKIVLGFIHENEQVDVRFEPRESVTVECDGSTIWLINEKGRHESTTTANLLDVRADLFEEITEDGA